MVSYKIFKLCSKLKCKVGKTNPQLTCILTSLHLKLAKSSKRQAELASAFG